MAIKLETGRWKCSYCNKVYDTMFLADSCRDNHDLVYVQLSKEELNKLVHFIYSKDERALDPATVIKLKKALRMHI